MQAELRENFPPWTPGQGTNRTGFYPLSKGREVVDLQVFKPIDKHNFLFWVHNPVFLYTGDHESIQLIHHSSFRVPGDSISITRTGCAHVPAFFIGILLNITGNNQVRLHNVRLLKSFFEKMNIKRSIKHLVFFSLEILS